MRESRTYQQYSSHLGLSGVYYISRSPAAARLNSFVRIENWKPTSTPSAIYERAGCNSGNCISSKTELLS